MSREKPSFRYHQEAQGYWDSKFERGWHEGSGSPRFFTEYVDAHKEELGHLVLDLGCGRGRNLVPLVEQGFDVTGLDFSKSGLDETKRALDQKDLDAKLVQGKTTELPFEDNSFDFVVSIGVIHHNTWEDIQKSFKEVGRVLREGQTFLFQGRSTKDNDRPRKQIDDKGYTAVDTQGLKQDVVQHYFTKDELQELADENGFEIVQGPEETNHIRRDNPDRNRARWWVVFRKKKTGETVA